jgi:hypothetical protein
LDAPKNLTFEFDVAYRGKTLLLGTLIVHDAANSPRGIYHSKSLRIAVIATA